MNITEQEIRRVAELANLALTDDEVAQMARDLSGILTHVDKLNELDTTGVEPMAQVIVYTEDAAGETAEYTATLREDRERSPLGNHEALANAPLAGSGYFKVPKVIER
jgi:aspartyl-tRNA(Asn)/glutamyl-tRNA(Gln) amidotransferase subunit C